MYRKIKLVYLTGNVAHYILVIEGNGGCRDIVLDPWLPASQACLFEHSKWKKAPSQCIWTMNLGAKNCFSGSIGARLLYRLSLQGKKEFKEVIGDEKKDWSVDKVNVKWKCRDNKNCGRKWNDQAIITYNNENYCPACIIKCKDKCSAPDCSAKCDKLTEKIKEWKKVEKLKWKSVYKLTEENLDSLQKTIFKITDESFKRLKNGKIDPNVLGVLEDLIKGRNYDDEDSLGLDIDNQMKYHNLSLKKRDAKLIYASFEELKGIPKVVTDKIESIINLEYKNKKKLSEAVENLIRGIAKEKTQKYTMLILKRAQESIRGEMRKYKTPVTDLTEPKLNRAIEIYGDFVIIDGYRGKNHVVIPYTTREKPNKRDISYWKEHYKRMRTYQGWPKPRILE